MTRDLVPMSLHKTLITKVKFERLGGERKKDYPVFLISGTVQSRHHKTFSKGLWIS